MFDRWAIVAGHYYYANDYHSGQWSDLYKKLCRISKYFHPSPLWKSVEDAELAIPGTLEVYNTLRIINLGD